jgi:16S rRNA (guanine527-N7)-methyltransferase
MGEARLVQVLERSRRLGFLGPGSARLHIDHALGFAAGVSTPPHRVLDLGSGGGVPGLVLALHWARIEVVLLDSGARRCAFLRQAVEQLDLSGRVTVVRARAEEAGHRPELRARCDLVVARGFGPPPVTAECAAPFLRVGGMLVVSEPPGAGGPDVVAPVDRWPGSGLALLGLEPRSSWQCPYHYQALEQVECCPAQFPRRVGVPGKRPLF